MTTPTKSALSTPWPFNLPPAAQVWLDDVKAAHAEASTAWLRAHPGTAQKQIPHADFLRSIGVVLGVTIFSRLISEKGYPGNALPPLKTLASAVAVWRLGKVFAQRAGVRPTHKLAWFSDLEEAAMNAAAAEEAGVQERAVVFIAKTGCGKTTLARHLVEKVGRAVIISASVSWRSGLYSVLSSFLLALGQPVPLTSRAAEVALMTFLTQNKITLILDEQDFFGRDALNLVRQILNGTRASVILLMIPETWDRLVRQGGEYGSQFCRRCATIVKAPDLTHREALTFLRETLRGHSDSDLKPAAMALAISANKFGGFSLLDNCSAALGQIPLGAGETLESKASQLATHYQQRHQTTLNVSPARASH